MEINEIVEDGNSFVVLSENGIEIAKHIKPDIVAEVDPRPWLHLEADKTEMAADDTEIITITGTLRETADSASQIQTHITVREYGRIDGYGAIPIDITNGEFQVKLTVPPDKSGRLTLKQEDSPHYHLANSIVVWALLATVP